MLWKVARQPRAYHRASPMLPPVLALSSTSTRALRVLSESDPYHSTSPVARPWKSLRRQSETPPLELEVDSRRLVALRPTPPSAESSDSDPDWHRRAGPGLRGLEVKAPPGS
eukprot:3292500-Rhodomonas_salina.1